MLVGGALELSEGCEVAGKVEAASVVVSGALVGDVDSRGAVAVTASGRLQGDVRGTAVTLEEGGHFVGEIDVEFDLPDAIA